MLGPPASDADGGGGGGGGKFLKDKYYKICYIHRVVGEEKVHMSGTDVRQARKALGWTQAHVAQRLGTSQAYVSLLESNRRSVPRRLAPKLVALLRMPASKLPVSSQTFPLAQDRVTAALGTLGYPGFAHVASKRLNPAELLVRSLGRKNVEARLVEAFPWLLLRFPDLDWNWLVPQAKQHDLQNRLGFLVSIARELAERRNDATAADSLRKWEHVLEGSRLQKEDAFAGDALTDAERRWLRTNRSPEAAQWNLLSNLSADTLARA
jgi:transcriptional regulator with XRE-family HTH domain